MSEPKYREIHVFPACNVSSTRAYTFRVSLREYRKGKFDRVRRFWYSVGFADHPRLPHYALAEIARQIVALHDVGGIKFYEHDREGNARWANYRYYDPEEWGGIVTWLDTEVAA